MTLDAEALWRSLMPFGLDEAEAALYYHLGRLGTAKAAEAAHAAGVARPDAYRILDALVKKGFVERTMERPARYIPIPLEAALNSRVQDAQRDVGQLEGRMRDLLPQWPATLSELDRKASHIAVHQGHLQSLGVLERLVAEATEEILLVATPRLLQRLKPLDARLAQRARDGLEVRLLTNVEQASDLDVLRSLRGAIRIRHLVLPSHLQALLADGTKGAIFVSAGSATSTQSGEETLLALRAPDFVLAQKAVFDILWSMGTEIEARARELQYGQSSPHVKVLRGRWVRVNATREMILRAKTRIVAVIGPNEADRWVKVGLGRLLELQRAAGVDVRILVRGAPVPAGLPGATRSPGPVGEASLVVDGLQAMTVLGSELEPAAVTWTEEWAVWTNHPEGIHEADSRLGVHALKPTRAIQA